MARPRSVLAGRIYLLTRRCTRRQFLLRPGKRTNQAIWYCLAEAAKRFHMDVLWFMACSNHLHMGIHDRHGNYPKFIAHLHRSRSLRIRSEHQLVHGQPGSGSVGVNLVPGR